MFLFRNELRKFFIPAILIAGLVISCSKGTQNPVDSQTVISVVSGNDQTGKGGEALNSPVVVQVTNSKGRLLEDITVFFQVIEGGGRIVDKPTVNTDSDGTAAVNWIIGSDYNALEISVRNTSFDIEPCYIYATGENPSGLNVIKTLSSLERLDQNLYEMTFHGNYGEILETMNRLYGGNFNAKSPVPKMENFYCSLFTAFGNPNNFLFGRSFDNPAGWKCLTVLGRYNPPDGYKSLALTRMRELGYEPGTNFNDLSFHEKEGLLNAAFFPPDGINEHGVVVGLANSPPMSYTRDYGKESVYITLLVREILDHAKNVDEAAEIAKLYNVIAGNRPTLDVHALVADPSGRSLVLEVHDGEMQAVPNTEPWQVITNSLVCNLSQSQVEAVCWRFRSICYSLENTSGNIDRQQGMNILQNVGNEFTQWSAIYDMTEKKITLALDFNFEKFFHFSFENE